MANEIVGLINISTGAGIPNADARYTLLSTIGGGSPNEVFIFQIDLHYQSTNIATKNKSPSFYP